MKRYDILSLIAELAQSQGMYGRLLRDLLELKSEDPEAYDKAMNELEAKNFKDPLDFIMWYEGG